MHLLVSTTRKILRPTWVCQTCRHIQHASKPPSTPLSTASLELRKLGPARTRFAPSPTGYLHLGSLRTALFNYLIAKATGGQFLLRIEDTDQKRTIPDAEERLFRDLEWAGIEWDEGPRVEGPYGPYKQSQRTAIYRDHAEQLLQSGHAYRCFCSPTRLLALAQHRSKLGLPPDYDRTCAHVHKHTSDDRAAKGEAHVIRLKVPDKYPIFNDLVYGLVRQRSDIKTGPKSLGSFEDPILIKTDGFPTYHLANVVDDHLMKITHVIRGSEWMSSTPKHLAMYQAFGWEPPAFAHVGLLLDKDKQKLSKRTGSIDIESWRQKGVFPETLTNFVALLGWSHSLGKDAMSMEDLIRNASMKYTRGDTVVGFEKLDFLQRRHAARYASLPEPSNPHHSLKKLAVKPIVALLDQQLKTAALPVYTSIPEGQARDDYIHSILIADIQSYTTPTNFIERNIYFFTSPSPSSLQSSIPALKLHKVSLGTPRPAPSETLLLFQSIAEIPETNWSPNAIREQITWIISKGSQVAISELEQARHLEFRKIDNAEEVIRRAWGKMVHGYFRWAIAAGLPGPDGAEMMRILGRNESLARLKTAEGIMREEWTKKEEKREAPV